MPKVRFEARYFSPNLGVPRRGTFKFTWAELAWAAISVGKGELSHLTRHGIFSGFEIVYRMAMLFANLKEIPGGHLVRSSAYEGLDPSEKGAISYFLGMAMTKLFCERYLDVPWLMHLDVYRSRFSVRLASSQRPDFFGVSTSGDWVVMESKGRTHGKNEAALQKAKQQSMSLVSINGQAPVLRAGLLSHFGGGCLGLTADDPEEPSGDFELQLERNEFFEGYYRPYKKWLGTVEAREEEFVNKSVRIARDHLIDAEVGIVLDDRNPLEREELLLTAHKERQGARSYLGRDGVFVRLGAAWSDLNMKKEPQERSREN